MIAPSRRPLIIRGALAAGVASLALAVPAAAQAHVTASASDTSAGAYTVVTFSVPHGCDGSPTTKVAIQLPDDITAVTPTRNSFYDVSTRTEKLKKPITDAEGDTLTERPDQVVYTAKTPLPDGERDSFELSLQIPEDAAGKTLTFPTVQTCEDGSTSWTQIPAAGQSEDDVEHPAPAVAVEPASGAASDGGGADASAEAGSGSDAAATSHSDSSDGASMSLVITSLVIGALGLLTGLASLIALRWRR